jgi:hypothetical protein
MTPVATRTIVLTPLQFQWKILGRFFSAAEGFGALANNWTAFFGGFVT